MLEPRLKSCFLRSEPSSAEISGKSSVFDTFEDGFLVVDGMFKKFSGFDVRIKECRRLVSLDEIDGSAVETDFRFQRAVACFDNDSMSTAV